MDAEEVIKFVPLFSFENDYEIMNEYPFMIRNKKTKNILKEFKRTNNVNDYPCVCLNTKIYQKHILIAKQFLSNDDPINKPQVDHKNRDKTDYHLENLRWTNQSQNCKNKSAHKGIVYEYVDEIPAESIIVDKYNNHEFKNYYYYNDTFYLYNGFQYRKLYVFQTLSGSLHVSTRDVNNKRVNINIPKFKQMYNLD